MSDDEVQEIGVVHSQRSSAEQEDLFQRFLLREHAISERRRSGLPTAQQTDHHFSHVAEVYLTVVDREMHGTGVGTAMLSAIETAAAGVVQHQMLAD